MAQTTSNYLQALRNDIQNKIASSNQNGKKMHLILCCSLLQTKSGSGASCCCNQAVAHPIWCQAIPRLARKQFDPQFYPVPVVSNEVTSKQSATNVCCRMEKDLPQGLEDDQAINLKSLYKSMQRRMKAVVDAQSGHLNY